MWAFSLTANRWTGDSESDYSARLWVVQLRRVKNKHSHFKNVCINHVFSSINNRIPKIHITASSLEYNFVIVLEAGYLFRGIRLALKWEHKLLDKKIYQNVI